MSRRTLLLATVIATSACARAPHRPHDPEPARTSAAAISPDALRAHLEFLASDALEGRESGTRGYDLAAEYVASRFRELGLEPAGTRGYFQDVPVRRSVLTPGSVSLTIHRAAGDTRYTDADHVTAYPSERTGEERITAPVAYVGHGVVAPEYARDDYAGVDVRGKFALILGGPPPGLPEEAAAHLGSPTVQLALAAERGAVGALFVYTPTLEARFPFRRLPPITYQPRLRWHDPAVDDPSGKAVPFSMFVDSIAAAAIMKDPASVTVTRGARIDTIKTANVAGLLRGSGAALAGEVIVVVSHLDHVGIGEPVRGDSIYNGALDNASGIASMLEVARTIRASRPARSVLLLAAAAEEKGLIGSDYFAASPTVDRGRMVAVVNIDGVLPFWEFSGIVAYGAESSTLHKPLERALKSMGLGLQPDPDPSQSIFTRSDHYSFVKRGVPSVFLQVGDGVAANGRRGYDIAREWSEANLHLPSDGPDQPFDYAIFARFTELHRRFLLELANDPQRPLWYEGDFFGDRFAPGAPRARR